MYCRYCGEKQQADAKFCHRCGKALELNMQSENEREKEEFFRRRKEKNKVYIILAFLFVYSKYKPFLHYPLALYYNLNIEVHLIFSISSPSFYY